MKKLIALLLAMILTLGMVACGETGQTQDDANASTGDTAGTTEATAGQTTGAVESDLAYVLANGKLVVGITEYAPMDYKDENGNWTGFDAELATLFAEELGVTCEFFVIGDWSKKFVELETKSIDVIWNGMTITEEVQANTSCSVPYVINAQVVVMKANKVGQFTTVESMKDLVFAVEEGSAGQEVAVEAGLTTVAKQDQAGALMEVASGAADACVIDITMAKAMTGEGTDYSDLGVGISLSSEEYGVGFRKGSDLTDRLNTFLAEKKADGTLDALAEKYGLTLAD